MKKVVSFLIVCLVLMSVCFTAASADNIKNCGGFSYFLLEGKAIITGYSLDAESVIIPDTLDGNAVSAVADRAFADNSNISTLVVAEGVESIGAYAFYNCPNLSSVTITGKETVIGEKAFCYKPFYKDGEYWADTTVDRKTLTFYGFGISTLYRYAEKYAYKYVDMGNSSMRGDPDYDREVTIKDATSIQKYLADINYFVSKQKKNADFNLDKTVDIRDATAIQRYIVGLDYYVNSRRVYIDPPEIWTGSKVIVYCDSKDYLSGFGYIAKFDAESGLFYADIPVIMDTINVGSDYEAEVYSNNIAVPQAEEFAIRCISYENWGLWTEYDWIIVDE